MIQVIAATFQDGVFKPDQRLDLAPLSRVRLIVESLDEKSEQTMTQEAWEAVGRLWQQSAIDSQGLRSTP